MKWKDCVKYIRLSKGFNKYEMIPADQDIYNHIDKNLPFYYSLYLYEQDHFDQYQKTKSVAGIRGLKTNKLIFDFDSKENIEIAKTDTITLCERLIKEGISDENFRLYFSGSKGFHVDVRTEQEFNRQEYESILNNFAGDLKTLDKKVTDEQRLFRAPLTKHQITGLFKIPLKLDQLKSLSINDITEKAKYFDFKDEKHIHKQPRINLPESILKLKDLNKIPEKITTNEIGQIKNDGDKLTYDIDFTHMPKFMKPERWVLAQGFFEAGERNDALHVLAAYYRAIGYTENECFHLLVSAAEKQAQRTGQTQFTEKEIKHNIISHIYGPHFKGGIYTVENSEILRKTVERCNLNIKKEENKIVRIQDVEKRFQEFAKGIRNNTLKTGIYELDENIMMTTGMVIGLLGAPGSAKTSISVQILEHMSKNEQHCIFHSMDMYEYFVYSKLVQRYTGYDTKTIYNKIESGEDDKKLKEAFDTIRNNMRNVHIDSRTGVTVEDIEQTIIDYEKESGVKPRFMVIDYLEKIHGPQSDPTHRTGYIASKLNDIAKVHDICIMLLLQPQKSAGDVSDPLLSMRKVKGASVIEQDCRVILTIWRPGFYPKDNRDDKFVSMAVVKNNMGGLHHFDFKWDGLRGKIDSLSLDDESELREVLQRAESRKAESNTSGFDF